MHELISLTFFSDSIVPLYHKLSAMVEGSHLDVYTGSMVERHTPQSKGLKGVVQHACS